MGIGAHDRIDKLLVEKYQNMFTVNFALYGMESVNQDSYKYLMDKLETFLDYNNSCYEDQDCDDDSSEGGTMNETANEIEQETDFSNPNNCYERLGVDIIQLTIGEGIVPFVENLVLPKILDLRKKLTDDYGYIIPNIRVMDSSKLDKNGYIIVVRNKVVYTGCLDAVLDGTSDNLTKYIKATEDIIAHIEDMCFQHAHRIMTKSDALKLMELVRSQDPTLVNDLIPIFISAIDLKKICANLISEKVSIKDIILVFELLNDYARYTQDVGELTQKLKAEL